MRKPNSDEVLCVNCGGAGGPTPSPPPSLPNGTRSSTTRINGNHTHTLSSDEEIEPAPAPLRERIAPSPTVFPLVDSSQALADKMLEGWTLLAEHCPRCSTPFVRSKEGRIYCVSCEMYAVRESDLRGQTQPQTQQAVQSSPAARTAPAPATISTQEEPTPITQVAALHIQPRSLIQATDEAPNPNGEYAGHLEVGSTAVAARLARSAQSLAGASSAEANALLGEIQKCVEVLSGIQGLLRA